MASANLLIVDILQYSVSSDYQKLQHWAVLNILSSWKIYNGIIQFAHDD